MEECLPCVRGSESEGVIGKESELAEFGSNVGRIGTVNGMPGDTEWESWRDSRGNVGDVGDVPGVFRRT